MTKEQSKAFNKCLDNGIYIYPLPITKTARPNVNIVINNNNNIKKGSQVFKQDITMTEKILELYTLIANKLD